MTGPGNPTASAEQLQPSPALPSSPVSLSVPVVPDMAPLTAFLSTLHGGWHYADQVHVHCKYMHILEYHDNYVQYQVPGTTYSCKPYYELRVEIAAHIKKVSRTSSAQRFVEVLQAPTPL